MVVIEAYEWPEHADLLTRNLEVLVARASSHDVVVVPLNAVYMTGSYNYVRVIEGGVSRERPVELGIKTETEVEIINGLAPGEEIVIR
jgi:multidrug efflux pump subunit AcrA (membrane-fusion protein)